MSGRSPGSLGVREVYEAGYDRLVGALVLAGASRGDAEDAAQEAFVRLIGRWRKISAYDDPQAWLRLVAFRLLSTKNRSVRRRGDTALTSHDGRSADPGSEQAVDLRAALRSLPFPQREVLVLFYLFDMPLDEIAHLRRIRLGTVKSRLSRGKAELARVLSVQEERSDAEA